MRRRTLLKGITTTAGVAAVGDESITQDGEPRRLLVEATGSVNGMDVIHDLRDEIGYVVAWGPVSAVPEGASYAVDLLIELRVPQSVRPGMDAAATSEPLVGLQWDKREQRIERVHETATGEGVRLGVLDDGVLGANPDSEAAHPDLPNVREDLSVNFTADRQGPGALGDDHGTHVAGTAAAAANGTGVVGVAPDAEIVDLRVFSGVGATLGDVLAAVVVGAAPESRSFTITRPPNEPRGFPEASETTVTGAACDVLNLALSTPPLVPVETDDPMAPDLPSLPEPYVPIPATFLQTITAAYRDAGGFAADRRTVLIASAGNEGVNLDHPVEVPGGEPAAPTQIPSGVERFVSVAATGPIGYGWPAEGFARFVGGQPFEVPIQTELPEDEPAFYSNFGADSIDLSAGGGNADLDAAAAGVPGFFYDLVLSTGFEPAYDAENPDDPANGGDGDDQTDDERPDGFVPTYTYKAGTSFAAPNVAGLAALLFEISPESSAETVRSRIERAARPLPIGRAGESTAPALAVDEESRDTHNVATDGRFDGDEPSAPGRIDRRFDPDEFRGAGHIDAASTVASFLDEFGE